MLFGWISTETSERRYLLSLGIKLGRYDRACGCYRDCMVPEEAYGALAEMAGETPPRAIVMLEDLPEAEA